MAAKKPVKTERDGEIPWETTTEVFVAFCLGVSLAAMIYYLL